MSWVILVLLLLLLLLLVSFAAVVWCFKHCLDGMHFVNSSEGLGGLFFCRHGRWLPTVYTLVRGPLYCGRLTMHLKHCQ